jgi:hypothetical protein
LEDEAARSRSAVLVEDLVSLEAPQRWLNTHELTTDDFDDHVELMGKVADAQGVFLDLEGDRNVLAVLAAFSPLAFCQWALEGVALDDASRAIKEAVLPHTGDRSAASSFSGASGSIAKNLVCPEFEAALGLQYVGVGEEIITDDFQLEDSGWPIESYDWGQLQYSSGFYRMLPDGSDSLLHAVLPDSHSNVIIDAWVRPIRGADNQTSYGIMCRESTASGYLNGYLFQITTDGIYDIIRYNDNQSKTLKGGQSDKVHLGDSWNHLTAICHGPRLALLINGSLVAQVDDDTHSEGKVGLAAWSTGSTGADIVIDDFYLSQPNDEVLAMLDRLPGS